MRFTQRVSALLGMGGTERQDPEAQLAFERASLCRLMDQYDRGLAAHSRLAEQLMSRTRLLEQEEGDLRARTAVQVRVGSRVDAARTALQLQTARRELAASREQLGQASATHECLQQARALTVAAAAARIDIIRPRIGDVRARRVMAELNEIASIPGHSQTLEQLRAMAKEQHGKADLGDAKAREAERAALEDFLAQDGGLVVEIGRRPVALPGQVRSGHPRIDGPGIPFMPIDWDDRVK
jgi:hypothetical protein